MQPEGSDSPGATQTDGGLWFRLPPDLGISFIIIL